MSIFVTEVTCRHLKDSSEPSLGDWWSESVFTQLDSIQLTFKARSPLFALLIITHRGRQLARLDRLCICYWHHILSLKSSKCWDTNPHNKNNYRTVRPWLANKSIIRLCFFFLLLVCSRRGCCCAEAAGVKIMNFAQTDSEKWIVWRRHIPEQECAIFDSSAKL